MAAKWRKAAHTASNNFQVTRTIRIVNLNTYYKNNINLWFGRFALLAQSEPEYLLLSSLVTPRGALFVGLSLLFGLSRPGLLLVGLNALLIGPFSSFTQITQGIRSTENSRDMRSLDSSFI
jgi:hypothetical protein